MGKHATTENWPELEKDMAHRLYELKSKKRTDVYLAIFLTSCVWLVGSMFAINYVIDNLVK